ncbi:CMRF35-like molecule 8 [Solea solea]|uniref:CMRF35-like molecule 8 n=1 Tax=Solea solea TaxID=90069 RepID=UPI00272D65CE|nr:CMRF35-like molecule 8 [Solea solea]
MKLFLLLVLWLTSGCLALSERRNCVHTWVKYTCKFAKAQNISSIVFELKHDGTEKFRFPITKLEGEDAGIYSCSPVEVCPYLLQTTYTMAKTTVSCSYPTQDGKSGQRAWFFCKKQESTCEEMTQSSVKSNGKFTLTATNAQSFSLSITNVSSQDAGVYWCGFKNKYYPELSLQKLQLKVQTVTTFTKSPKVGENVTYWCKYTRHSPTEVVICKGEDPATCQIILSTANAADGRFSMTRGKTGNMTIMVRNVTIHDTGTYWCGRLSDSERRFFHRFYMNVVSPWSPAASTSSPTTSTSSFPKFQIPPSQTSGVETAVLVPVIVTVVALLLGIVLISIYKLSRRNKEAAEQHRQDHVSEQMQERLHTPAGEDANDEMSLYYATIHFQNGSSGVGDKAVALRPSTAAACEYSTVRYNGNTTHVSPSRATEDPLYATVNKPVRA